MEIDLNGTVTIIAPNADFYDSPWFNWFSLKTMGLAALALVSCCCSCFCTARACYSKKKASPPPDKRKTE